MNDAPVLKQIENRVATLTLNRPERRNALSPQLLDLLVTNLDELGKDDAVRAVVIQGAGDKVFSSGYDLATLPAGVGTEDIARASENPLERAIQAIHAYPYPVIAMIKGYAYGAACELALSCDFRVAAQEVKMGFPPAKLGIIYPPLGLLRMVRKIGIQAAKELFFTGRSIEPSRVKALGLVDFYVERDQLEAATYGLATEIAANAPLSLKGIKRIIGIAERTPSLTSEEQAELGAMVMEAFNSEDAREGLTAFFEKRKPCFTGR